MNTIHYSINGSNTEKSIWSLCADSGLAEPDYTVTKDLTMVNCKQCQTEMPQIFSVLHQDNNKNLTVIAQILAKDRKQAINITVHFIDNGELTTLDGKGVDLRAIQLIQSTTKTFEN